MRDYRGGLPAGHRDLAALGAASGRPERRAVALARLSLAGNLSPADNAAGDKAAEES